MVKLRYCCTVLLHGTTVRYYCTVLLCGTTIRYLPVARLVAAEVGRQPAHARELSDCQRRRRGGIVQTLFLILARCPLPRAGLVESVVPRWFKGGEASN